MTKADQLKQLLGQLRNVSEHRGRVRQTDPFTSMMLEMEAQRLETAILKLVSDML